MSANRHDGVDHDAETSDLADVDRSAAGLVPETIGHYRILGIIGEGGMGTVYKAEQESPRRTVALKVIRAGVVSASLLRRFEHEAQILGRLDHPGIATIFEAGTFESAAVPSPSLQWRWCKAKRSRTTPRRRSLAHALA